MERGSKIKKMTAQTLHNADFMSTHINKCGVRGLLKDFHLAETRLSISISCYVSAYI